MKPRCLMSPLQHVPVISKTRAVMQFATPRQGCPCGSMGCTDDLTGLLNFTVDRCKSPEYWPDLVWVDTPHSGKTKLSAGPPGRKLHRSAVFEFGNNTMRRNFTCGVAGRRNIELGSNNHRVAELIQVAPWILSVRAHGAGGNGTPMRRYKIHQSKTERLHARMRGNNCCTLDGER